MTLDAPVPPPEKPRWSLDPSIQLSAGGIGASDAERQRATSQELLRRLSLRPGQVLADEVGMGKTFVALAVAASIARASSDPVVIMVPPRLADKWHRDARRFRRRCIAEPERSDEDRLRLRNARSGAELLRAFDDPPSRRAHIVILHNTALHTSERDPYIWLEVVRQGLDSMKASPARRSAVARFAHDLLRGTGIRRLSEDVIAALLDRHPSGWLEYLRGHDVELDDDPVPEPFLRAIGPAHCQAIVEALDRAPVRSSNSLDERLAHSRSELREIMREVWQAVFHSAHIRSPLLILDEAHHLKNPDTRLASLFLDPSTSDTSVLSGAFECMLFLTATPFQLGHHELLEVLRRFIAVRWDGRPSGSTPEALRAELDELGRALDRAHLEARGLDLEWGRLSREDIPVGDGGADLPEDWWEHVRARPPEAGRLARVLERFDAARAALQDARARLAPWVVRHLRTRTMSTEAGTVPRRSLLSGRAIVTGEPHPRGLEVTGDARFPFLLCARAQTILQRSDRHRAYFAEGLSSSYGAFRETSAGGRPVDDADVALEEGVDVDRVRWYVDEVARFLGNRSLPHPKIGPTVNRAVAHWQSGEKVLVFCHFRMTVRDVRDRLVEAVEQAIDDLACRIFRLPAGSQEEARHRVTRIVERLQDPQSPIRLRVVERLRDWVESAGQLPQELQTKVVELLRKTLSSPGFVVRHFPLDRPEILEYLQAQRISTALANDAAEAVADSLSRRTGHRLGYRHRVDAFMRHLIEDVEGDDDRDIVLNELLATPTEIVRHASGEVPQETRRRVLLGFNSPLLPEILVASEVMAEGLDLHLDCRHIIHHDLSWNPSALEQRTGRVDRLRCRADLEQSPIQVFLPYLEGTADEKMYRVVTDRARWFGVIMGETYQVDEHTTEALARRIPFPAAAAQELTLDLAVTGA